MRRPTCASANATFSTTSTRSSPGPMSLPTVRDPRPPSARPSSVTEGTVLLRAFLGGARAEDVLAHDDARLVRLAEADLAGLLGIAGARVVVFNGFSAHADRNDLLAYVRAITPSPGHIFVVHGEEKQSLSLAAAIQAEHAKAAVTVPRQGATYDL